MGIAPATAADLWAHARELIEVSDREGTPVYARRALVVLAVAGSAGDSPGYEAVARDVLRALTRIGLDPLPLFDAASALCDEADPEARRILLTLPRESSELIRDELMSRLRDA